MGGNEPAGQTTETQTSQPWSAQQPYLETGFQSASNIYSNPADYPQYYPGTQVAPLNPTQEAGLGLETALGLEGNSSVNAGNSYLTNELQGGMLPENNPYFGSMVSNTLSTTLPGIESQFAQGNAMNEPGAAFATGQGVGNALGNVEGNMFQQDIGNMNTAAMWGAPAMQQAGLTNAQAVLGAGGQEQSQAQQEINANISQWNYNQTLPENMLNWYQGLIGGNYGGTSSLSSPYFEPSTGSLILGGLTSLAPYGLMAAML